jgi:hypothetical protein
MPITESCVWSKFDKVLTLLLTFRINRLAAHYACPTIPVPEPMLGRRIGWIFTLNFIVLWFASLEAIVSPNQATFLL